MPRAGFEPATPATKQPHTYALDCAASGIGIGMNILKPKKSNPSEPNVVVEWLTFLPRILDVPGSNLGPETLYRD
jgi:hypothetical protein